ncbi:hypothetical protein BDBG_03634 [Blastomyces gilchristii SLH14081]|uniref:Uncharacterized protein n=1 Tax=Blastomyces gilchristii (strain SLH14081) TaxID=559298 RepID=A0A179UK50_BLAGS|nr:uncharacterized protein BDBG_03634 [Blastomyces gilchristii SLH14081]OAT07598.1 hypothetical protein BDBG_03634 [Blastomyces gilchristii SLH14081]
MSFISINSSEVQKIINTIIITENNTLKHIHFNVEKKNVKVKEKKQKNEKRKKVKKKSSVKKYSVTENAEVRVLKKQMTSVESVDSHDIEILPLYIENKALCKENAALKIKFRTIISLLQINQTILENDI